ncbi:hypothetical protein I313_02877 [Cryptococcus deuterogattii Ram5]|uniref:Uncharacterized protein n=1 Tax=Cryptococcus deuterogattii Ram5 TaxID=1296110 RepID=A0A0D0V0D7_9TREE|nr:hypothetical protein I313_02877 [Cryptococcus deuterogattii Ram5]
MNVVDQEQRSKLILSLRFFGERRRNHKYSTYRVDSPLSPKEEDFWKVAAKKEIYELRDLTENKKTEVLNSSFEKTRLALGPPDWYNSSCGWCLGGEVNEGGDGLETEVGEEVSQGCNTDSLARAEEDEDEEDDGEDGGYRVMSGLDDEEEGGAGLFGAWKDEQ